MSVSPDGEADPPPPKVCNDDPNFDPIAKLSCAAETTGLLFPSVRLAKTAPDPVVAGEDFQYTINMDNNGTIAIAGGTIVKVAEQLPEGATLVGATAGSGVSNVTCDGVSGLVTCSVTLDGDLAAGRGSEAGFTLTVTAPSTTGATVNYVSVAPDGTSDPPPPGANCTDVGCASASTTVTAPDLRLVKTAPAGAIAGSDVTYTIELFNDGTADLASNTTVLVSDQLPAGSLYVSATPGAGVTSVQCDPVQNLRARSCKVVLDGPLVAGANPADVAKFTLTATAPLLPGSVTNYASVAADGVSAPPTPGPNCNSGRTATRAMPARTRALLSSRDPGCAEATLAVARPTLLEKKMMIADKIEAKVKEITD